MSEESVSKPDLSKLAERCKMAIQHSPENRSVLFSMMLKLNEGHGLSPSDLALLSEIEKLAGNPDMNGLNTGAVPTDTINGLPEDVIVRDVRHKVEDKLDEIPDPAFLSLSTATPEPLADRPSGHETIKGLDKLSVLMNKLEASATTGDENGGKSVSEPVAEVAPNTDALPQDAEQNAELGFELRKQEAMRLLANHAAGMQLAEVLALNRIGQATAATVSPADMETLRIVLESVAGTKEVQGGNSSSSFEAMLAAAARRPQSEGGSEAQAEIMPGTFAHMLLTVSPQAANEPGSPLSQEGEKFRAVSRGELTQKYIEFLVQQKKWPREAAFFVFRNNVDGQLDTIKEFVKAIAEQRKLKTPEARTAREQNFAQLKSLRIQLLQTLQDIFMYPERFGIDVADFAMPSEKNPDTTVRRPVYMLRMEPEELLNRLEHGQANPFHVSGRLLMPKPIRDLCNRVLDLLYEHDADADQSDANNEAKRTGKMLLRERCIAPLTSRWVNASENRRVDWKERRRLASSSQRALQVFMLDFMRPDGVQRYMDAIITGDVSKLEVDIPELYLRPPYRINTIADPKEREVALMQWARELVATYSKEKWEKISADLTENSHRVFKDEATTRKPLALVYAEMEAVLRQHGFDTVALENSFNAFVIPMITTIKEQEAIIAAERNKGFKRDQEKMKAAYRAIESARMDFLREASSRIKFPNLFGGVKLEASDVSALIAGADLGEPTPEPAEAAEQTSLQFEWTEECDEYVDARLTQFDTYYKEVMEYVKDLERDPLANEVASNSNDYIVVRDTLSDAFKALKALLSVEGALTEEQNEQVDALLETIGQAVVARAQIIENGAALIAEIKTGNDEQLDGGEEDPTV